jgi:hypothetical protein
VIDGRQRGEPVAERIAFSNRPIIPMRVMFAGYLLPLNTVI